MNVAITGNIGSGKTTICKMLNEKYGIPVYYADDEARELIDTHPLIVDKITGYFGERAYVDGKLHRGRMAQIVFSDVEELRILNSFTHPIVNLYNKNWQAQQTSVYTLTESAVLFEAGASKMMQLVIGIYAPDSVRLKRIMERNGYSEAEAKRRMEAQMSQDTKMTLCDRTFSTEEVDLEKLVEEIHKFIMEKQKQNSTI